VVQAWCDVIYCRMPGFPGNTCRVDYIWKILERGVIARDPSEDFNIFAVRSHRGAICCKACDVADEALVSHIDE
jgi:hypothetical protein